jgi:hypothetical protein
LNFKSTLSFGRTGRAIHRLEFVRGFVVHMWPIAPQTRFRNSVATQSQLSASGSQPQADPEGLRCRYEHRHKIERTGNTQKVSEEPAGNYPVPFYDSRIHSFEFSRGQITDCLSKKSSAQPH